MEMVQGLFLNGVDGQRTGLAIHLTNEHTILIPTTTTDARLAIQDLAMVRTE
jgi:hypothetical protein